MIKSIEIYNFQAHKKTKLIFDKGINILEGHSSAGKTAIYRAIKKLHTNKPIGNSLISTWAKGKTKSGKEKIVEPFQIKVEFDNGIVEYYKDEKLTKYVVNGVVYKAVSTSVPQEVLDIMNMNEVNFAGQHDEPFLIRPAGKGGAEASRFLNSLINFSDADDALFEVEKNNRDANFDIKACEKSIIDTEKKLRKYENIKDLEDLVEDITSLELELKEDKEEHDSLVLVLDNYAGASCLLEDLQDTDKIEKIVSKLKKLLLSLENDKETKDDIEYYTNICSTMKKELDTLLDTNNLESIISDLKKQEMVVGAFISKKTSIEKCIEDCKKSEQLLNDVKSTKNISSLLVEIKEAQDDLSSLEKQHKELDDLLYEYNSYTLKVKEAEKVLKESMKELKKIGVVCPHCDGTGVLADV